MVQGKHKVCRAGSGGQPGLCLFDPRLLRYDECDAYPVQCCSKIEYSAIPPRVWQS